MHAGPWDTFTGQSGGSLDMRSDVSHSLNENNAPYSLGHLFLDSFHMCKQTVSLGITLLHYFCIHLLQKTKLLRHANDEEHPSKL